MGQTCCVWRKERAEEIAFEPKKNLLAIALVSVLEESCTGLRNKLNLLEEISHQYAFNHHCCYIDPTYLSTRFSLIEFQSPGTLVPQHYSLSAAFHTEIAYLIDEGLIERGQNYSVILLVKVDGSLHPFTVKRRTRPAPQFKPLSQSQQQQQQPQSQQQQSLPQLPQKLIPYYIVHDLFSTQKQQHEQVSSQGNNDKSNSNTNNQSNNVNNTRLSPEIQAQQVKGSNCKDIEFATVESLNLYLDMVQMVHRTTNSPVSPTIQLQLLSFEVSDEKSFSCQESESAFHRTGVHESSDEISLSDQKQQQQQQQQQQYAAGSIIPASLFEAGAGAESSLGSLQLIAKQASAAPTEEVDHRHHVNAPEHKLPSRHHSAEHFRNHHHHQQQQITLSDQFRRRKSTTTLKSTQRTRQTPAALSLIGTHFNPNNERINPSEEQTIVQSDNASTIKEMTEEHQTSAIDSFSTEIENPLRTTLDSVL